MPLQSKKKGRTLRPAIHAGSLLAKMEMGRLVAIPMVLAAVAVSISITFTFTVPLLAISSGLRGTSFLTRRRRAPHL